VKPSDSLGARNSSYDSGRHAHLQVRADDAYARNLASELARSAGLTPRHRVLELGAGFGRFTFPLLEHCASIVALDSSARLLDDLERTRVARGIPQQRLQPLCRDVRDLPGDPPRGPFDCVVGFYILHHLPDFATTIAELTRLLEPGGRMVFLEPNRRNPLFLLQVACCPDMPWSEEKGMFQLSAAKVEDAYCRAGLAEIETRSFGFFPPPVFNRLGAARRLERRLERLRWRAGVLPYLLLSARAPERAA
jgi:SAM-dependent methyltransferase